MKIVSHCFHLLIAMEVILMNNVRRFTIVSSALPSYWYAKYIGEYVDISMDKSPIHDSLPLVNTPHNRETFGHISYPNYYICIKDLDSLDNEEGLHLLASFDSFGDE
jgi:hypothetical protein